jgi:hypothetical protein
MEGARGRGRRAGWGTRQDDGARDVPARATPADGACDAYRLNGT